MSGNRIIPILDVHKDVYVHGGAVRKAKYATRSFTTELVLCTDCTFKLHQHPPKVVAKPSSTGEGAEATASPPPPPVPPRPLLQWRMSHAFIHSVIPLGESEFTATAAPYGFAVLFFSFKPPKVKQTPLLQRAAAQCEACNFRDLMPRLRAREYVCASEFEQEDWLTMYRVVLMNYWHKRLEESIIAAPEVFQFQCFGCTATGAVQQAIISTTRLYIVPRNDVRCIEADNPGVAKRFVVATLELCSLQPRGTLLMRFGDGGDVSIGFFSHPERSTFILELQRIFELCCGSDAPFPYEVKSEV